jgi:hypothetical protein
MGSRRRGNGRQATAACRRYGQHLTLEQAAAYQRPSADSIRAIETHAAKLGAVVESRTLAGTCRAVDYTPAGRTVTRVVLLRVVSLCAAGDKIVVRLRNANVTAAELLPPSLRAHVDLVDGPAAILGSMFPSLRNGLPARRRLERRTEATGMYVVRGRCIAVSVMGAAMAPLCGRYKASKDPLACLADRVTAKCLRFARQWLALSCNGRSDPCATAGLIRI